MSSLRFWWRGVVMHEAVYGFRCGEREAEVLVAAAPPRACSDYLYASGAGWPNSALTLLP